MEIVGRSDSSSVRPQPRRPEPPCAAGGGGPRDCGVVFELPDTAAVVGRQALPPEASRLRRRHHQGELGDLTTVISRTGLQLRYQVGAQLGPLGGADGNGQPGGGGEFTAHNHRGPRPTGCGPPRRLRPRHSICPLDLVRIASATQTGVAQAMVANLSSSSRVRPKPRTVSAQSSPRRPACWPAVDSAVSCSCLEPAGDGRLGIRAIDPTVCARHRPNSACTAPGSCPPDERVHANGPCSTHTSLDLAPGANFGVGPPLILCALCARALPLAISVHA
jgi:hypothetical protein